MSELTLAKNRAEELGYDVWEEFVIPPYFEKLNLNESKKPKILLGGRGTGKTMIIRYLSHLSTFSKRREYIPDSALDNVGLYWKVDTQFAHTMQNRGIDEEVWIHSFIHFSTLKIFLEILSSLKSICESNLQKITLKDLENLDFQSLSDYDYFPNTYHDLLKTLQAKIRQFHGWLSNIKRNETPFFLPKDAIFTLIDIIKEQIPSLQNTVFFIYFDEYENLVPYQQKIINTWVKHSEIPLIFNMAMKRNSFKERRTLGNEQISDIHDVRIHDLESYFDSDNSFEVFASEILFLKLGKTSNLSFHLDESKLKSIEFLEHRKSEEYRKTILEKSRRLFPGKSKNDLSDDIFNDDKLLERLKDNIGQALKLRKSNIPISKFINKDYSQASLVVFILLSRKNLNPDDILIEFEKLRKGERNKFKNSSDSGWIHNLFLGALILFYAPLNRICPIYCGFDNFILMSRNNLRHFLELCHKSMTDHDNDLPIKFEKQFEAAVQASTSFLGEIKSFGKSGNKLYTFLLRIGYLMRQSHRRLTQSEPEMTHFSLTNGNNSSQIEIEDFLEEAVKWSVLFQEKSTKNKDAIITEEFDYVLNPIYAPYFQISYRKGRKLNLNTEQIKLLIEGDIDSYKKLVRKFTLNWDISTADSISNFSQLNFFE